MRSVHGRLAEIAFSKKHCGGARTVEVIQAVAARGNAAVRVEVEVWRAAKPGLVDEAAIRMRVLSKIWVNGLKSDASSLSAWGGGGGG
eukprot:SAG31_NODE_23768_length_496_cov_1.138539_1_plen_87_part_10